MKDFAFSVPPQWWPEPSNSQWGLSKGFGDSGQGAQATAKLLEQQPRPKTVPAKPKAPKAVKLPKAEWEGINDVAQSMARMFDEIDYGVLLLTQYGQLLYANHTARHELAMRRGLCTDGHAVACVSAEDRHKLMAALQHASQGKRWLEQFGPGQRAVVSFSPLSGSRFDVPASPSQAKRVLAVMGKSQLCEDLSVRLFAKLHHLTAAEASVLSHVASGLGPEDVATSLSIALSTVNTHLKQIRNKTGSKTLRDILFRMAALPPLVPTVKTSL